MADRRDVHYSEMGITSFEMLPTLITGTAQDVVDAAYISREHAERAKYEDNDRTEDSLRHMLLGGLIELNPEQEKTIGRDIASFLIDFREGDAPEDQIDLNNNMYGRRLREMYPDREEFIQKAIEIADLMAQGKEPPEVDGISLQKSFGSFETPEKLAEFERENPEVVYQDEGGLMANKEDNSSRQFSMKEDFPTGKAQQMDDELEEIFRNYYNAINDVNTVAKQTGLSEEEVVRNIRDQYSSIVQKIYKSDPDTFKNFIQDPNTDARIEALNELAFGSNPDLPYDEELGDKAQTFLNIPFGSEGDSFLGGNTGLRGLVIQGVNELNVAGGKEDRDSVARHEAFHLFNKGEGATNIFNDIGVSEEILARSFDYVRGLVGGNKKVKNQAIEFFEERTNLSPFKAVQIVVNALPQLYDKGVFSKDKATLDVAQEVIKKIDKDQEGYFSSLFSNDPEAVEKPIAEFPRTYKLAESEDTDQLKELLSVIPFAKGVADKDTYNQRYEIDREAAGMDEGGLMLAPGGAVTKAVKTVLAPTAVALGLSESEDAEAAYIPLKAFAEGTDAAKAFFAKAQKRIDEGADTAPNGELYDEMGVYMSEDGELKVDVPELRARDVEAMQAIANFQEDLNFYLTSKIKRKKATSNPITRYLPENSPIFENFPDLKNAKVVMQPSTKYASGGMYDPELQLLYIYVDRGANLSPDKDKERIAMKTMHAFNTFIHEFQHHIQDVKKAANTGYSPQATLVGFRGFEKDYFDAVEAIDKLQPGEIGYDQFKNRIDMMFDLVRDSYRTEKQRVAFDRAEYSDKLVMVKNSIENFKSTTGKVIESDLFRKNIYFRELGEAEARSAAAKGLLVGDERKAVGIYYPKDTPQARRVLSPEDIQLEEQIKNTHVLTRVVPAYNFSKLDSDMRELAVTEAAPRKLSKLEKEQQKKKGEGPSSLGPAAVVGATAGLASPPSEAFVSALGAEDPTPTPSLFDVADGAVPNELGITNTFLLDLLVPRTKPYDLVTSVPGLGEGLMAADILSSFKEDKPQDYPEVMADAP